MKVKISPGNSKLGDISSVSLPAGLTCRNDCECIIKCYAKRLERFRSSVHSAYMSNYELLMNEPESYWREVEASIMMSRFFRFHVSGDIVNYDYLDHMVGIARRNPHCEILCFTKKYDIVNDYIDKNGKLPKNLKMLFSVWRGLSCDNRHNLPEAHIEYKDGTTTAGADAIPCSGNCTNCVMTKNGCWDLLPGQQVVISEH